MFEIFRSIGNKRSSSSFKESANVALVGAAGWPNYGDEIILDGWLDYYYKNHVPLKNVYVFQGTKRTAEKIHKRHLKREGCFFSDALERVANSYDAGGFWSQVLRGYDFVENKGEEKYSNIDLSAFRRCSRLHLHGGGYLNDFWPQRGFFVGFLAKISEITGANLCATGIGFGPVQEPRHEDVEKLKKIFSLYDFFELRDVESFRFLRKNVGSDSFLYGIDDCYIKSISDVVKQSKISRLYLSFLKNSVYDIDKQYWLDLEEFSRRFDEVVFFESSPSQDKEIYNYIKRFLPSLKLLKVTAAIEKGIDISPNDYAITSRFHVHYMLARAGIDGQYSTHNQTGIYYDVKHQSIIDKGSPFVHTDFDSLRDDGLKRKNFMKKNENLCVAYKLNLANDFYL